MVGAKKKGKAWEEVRLGLGEKRAGRWWIEWGVKSLCWRREEG